MPEQRKFTPADNYAEFDAYLKDVCGDKVMLVCDSSIGYLSLNKYFLSLGDRLGIDVVRFSDFFPNPEYESVVKGVNIFRDEMCGAIIAVGGGSSMDVAKCIKLFSNMDEGTNYLEQPIVPNDIPLIAIPTTAGTGSEATRYAVIYYKGAKQSVTDGSCIPSAVLFDPGVLDTLPMYQRKSTMLDALCHSIESFWSVNSTDESKEYSRQALNLIMKDWKGYINNSPEENAGMMTAANLAGQAINITETTAGHAMCYKITSLFGVSHGHAAALCVRELWPYMTENTGLCIDVRGEEYLRGVFNDIARAMGCETSSEAIDLFRDILDSLDMSVSEASPKEFDELCSSVNPVRLRNNPVKLDDEAICCLYHRILRSKES